MLTEPTVSVAISKVVASKTSVTVTVVADLFAVGKFSKESAYWADFPARNPFLVSVARQPRQIIRIYGTTYGSLDRCANRASRNKTGGERSMARLNKLLARLLALLLCKQLRRPKNKPLPLFHSQL